MKFGQLIEYNVTFLLKITQFLFFSHFRLAGCLYAMYCSLCVFKFIKIIMHM